MKWKNKTRGGYPVRIYAEDGAGEFPIHGAMYRNNGWRDATWTSEGAYTLDGQLAERNLIPVTPIIDWSAQPAWCKAVVKERNGRWFRFDTIPFIDEVREDETWISVDGEGAFEMHPSEYPAFDGDRQDSLCVRPEGGAK